MSAITLVRQGRRPMSFRTIGLIALLVLLLAATFAIYAGGRRSVPAPFGPAANGLVAFEDAGDIVVLDPASGMRRVAVEGEPVDSAPRFSRDGGRLAYLRLVDGETSLWIANADGSQQRALSGGYPGLDDSIQWSPDAQWIMLVTDVAGTSSISIFPTDGSQAVRTLDVGMTAENPSWRPPEGQEILFRGTTPSGFGLFAVRPDGTGLRPVVPATGRNEWDGLFADWSPDGTRIAYQWRDGDGLQLVYVVPAEGGDRRAVTSVESVDPKWSPDGSAIAYNFESTTGAGLGVGVVPAAGSTAAVHSPTTFEIPRFAWTPDGTGILARFGLDLVLMDPATGETEPAPWASASLPSWQRAAP